VIFFNLSLVSLRENFEKVIIFSFFGKKREREIEIEEKKSSEVRVRVRVSSRA
jgi:hypothetical protein